MVAFFTGFFPRYNRLIAESGFPEAAQAIRAAWLRGDQAGAAHAVPDALLTAVGVVGTPTECASASTLTAAPALRCRSSFRSSAAAGQTRNRR